MSNPGSSWLFACVKAGGKFLYKNVVNRQFFVFQGEFSATLGARSRIPKRDYLFKIMKSDKDTGN